MSEIDLVVNYDDNVDDKDTTNEIPREQRVLRTQAYDKSISDIINLIREEEIILNPDFQRNYVWDNKKASLLIESILLNVPIPVVYVAEEEDSRWTVVDGLQRLNSLRRFFDNEFKLTGLEVLTELKGLQFSTLNPKASRILKNGILRIILIFKESNPEIKYDIFMRLNRGSKELTEQELRNCLYRGEVNNLINKRLRVNKSFLTLIGFPDTHTRFADSELILRYFTISESFNRHTNEMEDYQGRMVAAMSRFYEKYKVVTPNELSGLETKFNSTVNKVIKVLGPHAFQRISLDGVIESRLNRSLMDCIMLSFEDYSLEQLESHSQAIKKLHATLIHSDKEFADAITLGTSDKKKLDYRLKTWIEHLKNIITQTHG